MAVSNITYGSDTAITFDISSLAGDSNLLAGRECSQIDNTTNVYHDAMVFVDGINGHASTAPVIGEVIQLFAWGATESLATTAIDVLDGVDSAETLAHDSVLRSLRRAGVATVTEATANLKYWIQPFGVAALFDGVLPPFWGLFLVHNHTGALAASQSGLFSYRGITYTST